MTEMFMLNIPYAASQCFVCDMMLLLSCCINMFWVA